MKSILIKLIDVAEVPPCLDNHGGIAIDDVQRVIKQFAEAFRTAERVHDALF